MTTVTFSLQPIGNIQSHLVRAGAQDASIVAAGSGYFLAAALPTPDKSVSGLALSPAVSPIGQPFPISTNEALNNIQPDSATLTNGNVVTTYTSLTAGHSKTFIAIHGPTGQTIKSSFVFPGAQDMGSQPSVTTLSNGGFLVVTSSGNSGHLDGQRYNAVGATVGDVFGVDSPLDFHPRVPSVSGLTGGRFVAAFVQPGPQMTSGIAVRTFSAAAVGDDEFSAGISGAANDNPEVIGLKDGGFALAFETDGFTGQPGKDIALQFFNADGSTRGDLLRANAANLDLAEDGDTTGDQVVPTLTQLSNGAVVVGWENDGSPSVNVSARAFDPKGSALTGVVHLAATSDPESDVAFAARSGGLLAAVWSRFNSDTGEISLFGGEMQLARKSVGTSGAEKIKGDDLTDRMSGLGGKDKLLGGGGDDSLKGGKDDDKLKGGSGADVLNGGKGADKLYAGKDDARDVFVFHKGDSGTGDGSFDQIFSFDRKNGHEKVHDVIDLTALHVTLKDIDLAAHKHSVTLLVDYHGSGQPGMAIEVMKVTDLNPGDLLL